MNAHRTVLLIAVLLVPVAALAAPVAGPKMELAQATPPAPGLPGGPPTGPQSPPPATPPALPQAAPLPPPLPPQVTAQFFYNDGGKPAGPFSVGDLRAKVAAGAITSATLVWKAGTPDWVAARDQPEVAALLVAPPPPAPGPPGPPSVATAAALDPNTYLLGTWQSDDQGPPGSTGPARLTITFIKGGSLTGTYAYSPGGSASRVNLPVTGFWTAEQAGNRRANIGLSLLIQNGAQVQTLATTSVVDLVDNNTLRDVSDGSLTTRVVP